MVSAHIRITGQVQGVGFRYFTLSQANAFGLKGYVRNRGDGSVEVRVEGEKEIIERFKSILEKGPGYSAVQKVEISFEQYSAKYKKFSVDY